MIVKVRREDDSNQDHYGIMDAPIDGSMISYVYWKDGRISQEPVLDLIWLNLWTNGVIGGWTAKPGVFE